MFTLSIVTLMALPTLAIGLLPTYAALGIAAPLLLLLLRILQGVAIRREVSGAWVFVAEHVPSQRIGFACGALTVGILLVSFVATLLSINYSPPALSPPAVGASLSLNRRHLWSVRYAFASLAAGNADLYQAAGAQSAGPRATAQVGSDES